MLIDTVTVCFLAIIPLAKVFLLQRISLLRTACHKVVQLLGLATEELALRTGQHIAALINVTLGNTHVTVTQSP